MKIHVWLSTDLVGTTIDGVIEVDDAELAMASEEERKEIIREHVREWRDEQVEYGWNEASKEDIARYG